MAKKTGLAQVSFCLTSVFSSLFASLLNLSAAHAQAQPTPGVKPEMPPSTASRRPDLFAPLPYYEKQDNFFISLNADLRYRTVSASGTKETIGTYISSARFTTDYIRANPKTGDERGGVRFQLLWESDERGTRMDKVRVSEAYGFYRFLFPGVSASFRAGQFVLPFGLTAIYDTPLQPIQTLYEKSLGLRVDTGIMLEGDYNVYHYAVSLTRGVGPNKGDEDETGIIAFRLSRILPANIWGKRLGQFQVGGSLLSGRAPITGFSTELPASGQSGARGTGEYVKKTRFAADGEWVYGNFYGRGEIIFGSDDQDSVWGYFAEGNYRFARGLSAVVFGRRWNFPNKPERSQTIGIGVNYDLTKRLTIRSLAEYEEQVPADASIPKNFFRRFTIQTRLDF